MARTLMVLPDSSSGSGGRVGRRAHVGSTGTLARRTFDAPMGNAFRLDPRKERAHATC